MFELKEELIILVVLGTTSSFISVLSNESTTFSKPLFKFNSSKYSKLLKQLFIVLIFLGKVILFTGILLKEFSK